MQPALPQAATTRWWREATPQQIGAIYGAARASEQQMPEAAQARARIEDEMRVRHGVDFGAEVDAAEDDGLGLAILIDEAQDLSHDELVAIGNVAHRASQRQRPVLFVLAGLPSLPTRLAEAKSYSERLFHYRQIRELEPAAAAAALTVPASEEQVEWEAGAVALVVAQTGGYPYFPQEYGSEAWLEAQASPISAADAKAGAGLALRHLDDGFYRTRWDRATPLEKEYLRAMAADGDVGSRTADVARRMDRTPQRLSKARQQLADKGLVYAPEHGRIAFTVPWMAAFIHRQPN